MAGFLIRQAVFYQHEHPALTDRRNAYQERTLDVLLAIARRLRVPESDLPPSLPDYDRAWLTDLCNIPVMDAGDAERARRTDPDYEWNSYSKPRKKRRS